MTTAQFFKQYHVEEVKLPAKQLPRINTQVAEVMAWKDGKRVGFGSQGIRRQHALDPAGRRPAICFTRCRRLASEIGSAAPAPGLGIAASDAEELSGLVNSKTPVTITE